MTAPPPPSGDWPARYASALPDGRVRCGLCPHACRPAPGETGRCRVRRNADGRLIADTYGRPVARQIDPIEKKPLRHYLPGSRTYSIGTYGCNFTCRFCQNDDLSRHGGAHQRALPFVAPEALVEQAQRHGCRSIAFTYNEPTVFFEYMVDTARRARAAGLGTVLVSNGYINPEPRAELYPLIDAANIDIKAFSDDFYARLCGARLAPVLDSCRAFKRTFGKHLEITNLLIPGHNDQPEMIGALLDWVAAELGRDTPLHVSAYFPRGGFTAPPTPAATVCRTADLARRQGFEHVYTGNL